MFVQEMLRKKERMEKLIGHFMLMGDYFELYRFTNDVNEIEYGMESAAHKLFSRDWAASGGDRSNEYMLQQARVLLARARSDRAMIPYDSLGHCRTAIDDGTIPPVSPDREAYPADAPREEQVAYRLRIGNEILAYIDNKIDLEGYSLPDAARCLIDAALRRAPMSFCEECVADMPAFIKRMEKAERALLDRELGADRYTRAT